MPKINVYLPDDLAAAVKEAQVPVSSICQSALEWAVRDVTAVRASEQAPAADLPATGVFARFTPRARAAVIEAENIARAFPHNYVGTEHVLLGVLTDPENLGYKVIKSLDVEPDDLRAELQASLLPPTEALTGHIPFTPRAKLALEATTKEALALGHNYIGCEHILLGLLQVEEGLASRVMRRMGIELSTTKRAVIAALTGVVHGRSPRSAAPARPSATGEESKLDEILRRLDAIEERLAG